MSRTADDTADDTAADTVEDLARERLGAAERDLARRPRLSLADAFGAFWRHPSPWMISVFILGTLTGRLVVGDWAVSDLWAPLVFLALFPFIEWTIHVFVLHWRPRRVAGVYVDTLLARDHRRHHADPRDVPLVFVPWRALVWVILLAGAVLPLGIGLVAGASLGAILTYMLVEALALGGYEWTHYLIHSDYRPRSRAYKAIWRNHRLHHYKNEHYWFSITTSGTSDRVLGTYPDPSTVPTSRTAKNLHGEAPG
jgi:hypothetical protein